MKLKSLLFGSAAVLAAGTGAQAADLPTVEPVEYVRICDVFGTGFFYIPGTETCLKLSGYVRVETRLIFDDDERAEQLDVPPQNVNNYSTRVRGHVEWDARTQTEFGLIRAFIGLEGTRGPQSSTPDGTGPGGSYSYSEDFGLASAFIQVSNDWGTFTTGKFGSFFDFWADYGWNGLGTEPGTEDPNLAAWTFAGGNGFSFSISAEDPDSVDRRRTGDDDYEGLQSPDGVANIRVDQGWGSAQIMGVIHPVHDQFGGDLDDTAIGWAVGGGVSLGIPGGWSVSAQGGYSEGALHYISGDPDGMGDLDGAPPEDLNTAWAVRAGVTGPVMTNVTAWAQGAFYHFEEDDGTDEYDFIGASGGFAWEPAPGLRMGPEVGYNSVDWDGAFPDDGDYDVWGLMWRMQRSF